MRFPISHYPKVAQTVAIAVIVLGLTQAFPASAQFSPDNDAQESMGDATLAMCPTLGVRRDNGIPQSQGEAGLNAFCDALVGGQFSETNGVLQRVNGEELQNAQSRTTEMRDVQISPIMSRMTAVRSGQAQGSGVSAASLDDHIGDDAVVVPAAYQNDDSGALLSSWNWQKLGIFMSSGIRFGDKDETSQAGAFSFDTKGLTFGLDYRFDDDVLLGAALGYSSFDADFDVTTNSLSGQDLGSNGVTLAVFASYFPSTQFFVDGVLSLGWLSYDSKRRIVAVDNPNDDADVDDIDGIAKGKFDSFYYGLSARTGYETKLIGRVQMIPTLQIEYVKSKTDSFKERSNDPSVDAVALRFGSQDAESLTSQLGFELSRGFDTPVGAVIPSVRAFYVHEFLKDDEGVVVGYRNDPTRLSDFELRTEGRDRHYGILGANLRAAELPYGLTAFVDYATTVDLRDFDVSAVNVGLRKAFQP